jgi:hypothetical protein
MASDQSREAKKVVPRADADYQQRSVSQVNHL